MSNESGWDWTYLLYISVTVLGFSEHEFWYNMTPRKFGALARMHIEFTNPEKRKDSKVKIKKEVTTIDKIPGF